MLTRRRLGATPLDGGRAGFLVWAPHAGRVEVILEDAGRVLPMAATGGGYHELEADAPAGARYRYRLDGGDALPDPASRSQPEGVHGPSAVVDPAFPWTDDGFRPPPLAELVLYELHVGTFTPEGTFDAAIGRLDELAALGVTALELMPLAQFPGIHGWGYDGVDLWAVHAPYGGPDGLRRLVDAAHARGLAVHLDVVYNHFGPEGCYLPRFGPYLSDRHRTPWGDAVNVDGPGSDEVRRFLVGNAVHWLEEHHVDGLRLDAIQGIIDTSALPFLRELGEAVRAVGERTRRPRLVIAESDLNDPQVVRPAVLGGLGLDAAWADDLHHALHVVLTGERHGHLGDFAGLADVAAAYRRGFVYDGRPSAFRGRRHGAPADGLGGERFVVCAQNHDQVGNRPLGERLATVAGLERAKLAAAAVLASPFVPLLFMGEEHAEPAPFLYFTDHGDPELVAAVREGRRRDFPAAADAGELPDPASAETRARSVVTWERRHAGDGAAVLALYTELLRLRRTVPALGTGSLREVAAEVRADDHAVIVHRRHPSGPALLVLHVGAGARPLPLPAGPWRIACDTADARYGGPGGGHLAGGRLHAAPTSAVVLVRGAGR